MKPLEHDVDSVNQYVATAPKTSVPLVEYAKRNSLYAKMLQTPTSTMVGNVADRPDVWSNAILGYN